jgi:hypothetical protein
MREPTPHATNPPRSGVKSAEERTPTMPPGPISFETGPQPVPLSAPAHHLTAPVQAPAPPMPPQASPPARTPPSTLAAIMVGAVIGAAGAVALYEAFHR